MGYSKDKTDGVEADPVLEPLLKILAEGQVLGSKQELATHMASDKVTKFKPLGKINNCKIDNSLQKSSYLGGPRNFESFEPRNQTVANPPLKED